MLVRDIFCEEDVKIILATPIREDFEDFHAWHYDEKGAFSVKSACQVYIQNRDNAIVATTSEPVQDVIEWKRIWKTPCQPKVQQFLWRLAHNSLPFKLKIKRRGIECDTLCVCCKRLDEDGCHLFVKCKEVKKLWREMGMEEVRLRLCTCAGAKEMVQAIFRLPEEDQTLVAFMLWKWWDRRNKINSGEQVCPIPTTASQARLWAMEFMQLSRDGRTTQSAKPVCQWKRPEGDQLKINLDGAFQETAGTGGWGFLIRDNTGDVRGAGTGKIPNVRSAEQSEAEACMHAIEAAADWGMTNVCIESDCKNLISALQSNDRDLAPQGIFYRDMRQFIRLNFSVVSYMHVPRACNKIAHELAAMGSNGRESSRLWSEDIPQFVNVLVASECAAPVE